MRSEHDQIGGMGSQELQHRFHRVRFLNYDFDRVDTKFSYG